jgi:hypothetical protein
MDDDEQRVPLFFFAVGAYLGKTLMDFGFQQSADLARPGCSVVSARRRSRFSNEEFRFEENICVLGLSIGTRFHK